MLLYSFNSFFLIKVVSKNRKRVTEWQSTSVVHSSSMLCITGIKVLLNLSTWT